MFTTLLLVYCTLFRVNPIPVEKKKKCHYRFRRQSEIIRTCILIMYYSAVNMPKVYNHAVAIRYLTLCTISMILFKIGLDVIQNQSLHRTHFSYRGGWVYQVVFQEACFLHIKCYRLSNWQNTDYFWREMFSPKNFSTSESYSRPVPNCSPLSIGATPKVYSQSMKEIPTFQEHHKILIFTSILHNISRTYHTAVKHWLTNN